MSGAVSAWRAMAWVEVLAVIFSPDSSCTIFVTHLGPPTWYAVLIFTCSAAGSDRLVIGEALVRPFLAQGIDWMIAVGGEAVFAVFRGTTPVDDLLARNAASVHGALVIEIAVVAG